MNFLQAYQIYSSGNEAPEEFHQWGAYAALSAACGPYLWTDMGGVGNIQPNLFILYVGPPGIKKSTAKDFVRNLMREVSTPQHPIPTAPSSTSKEAFVDFMANPKSVCRMAYKWEDKMRPYTKCSIFANEFVNLVQVGGDPLAWIQVLTDIYDPQPNYDVSTISRGAKEIPYPYLTLLGCMTPELTRSLINENALSGGFSRRVLYIYGNKNGPPVPRPITTPEQEEAKKFLVRRCRQIQTLQGKFEFTGAGFDAYDAWYRTNYKEMESATSAAVVNFLQSKAVIVTKVAMLSRLAWSDELQLDAEDIEVAAAMVTSAQKHIDTIFSGVGRNPHAATISGIRALIDSHCSRPPGYITKKKIYGAFLGHASTSDIDSLLRQMEQIDLIRTGMIDLPGGQRIPVVTSIELAEKIKTQQGLAPPLIRTGH